MGYFLSKSLSINYFHTLPAELRIKLCSYFTDILDILEVLKISILNNNVYDTVTLITANSCTLLSIDDLFQFKRLEICHSPIEIINLDTLETLAFHNELKQFILIIPSYIIGYDLYIFSCRILLLFKHFIDNRKSIKNMSIIINIKSHSPTTRFMSIFSKRFTIERYITYKFGCLSVDNILTCLPFHDKLVTLLTQSDNIISYTVV